MGSRLPEGEGGQQLPGCPGIAAGSHRLEKCLRLWGLDHPDVSVPRESQYLAPFEGLAPAEVGQ